ncbi:MAG: alpha-ketoglutarate-dependent dioxygenase AlkB [Devosia sp.]
MTPAHPVVEHLDEATQIALLDAVVESLSVAPFFQPTLPRWGTPFSVRMTNLGVLGWVSDKRGYRYEALHPDTGTPWAPMPQMLLDLWQKHSGYAHPPEACLVNHYGPKAKMGLHQDRDEADFDAPVLSVSLGDSARFRLGGTRREDPTTSFMLESGDVMMLAGPERLAFHGIDRLMPGTSSLLGRHAGLFPEGGRINLTLRRVTLP